MENFMSERPMKKIVTRYVTRNGKIIYPKNGRFFCFYVPDDGNAAPQQLSDRDVK